MTDTNLDDVFDPDTILDAALDDLEDAPEFLNGSNLPRGTYSWLLNTEVKNINGHPVVEFKLKLVEVEELVNPEEGTDDNGNSTLPPAGSMANMAFFIEHEMSRGQLKKHLKVVAEHFDLPEGTSTRDVLSAIQDLEILGVMGHRNNQNNPDEPYLSLKQIAVI